MGSISEFFSAQHRACDKLFEQMETAVSQDDWQQAARLYRKYSGQVMEIR